MNPLNAMRVVTLILPLMISSTYAAESCFEIPSVSCILDTARTELDDFAKAKNPPESSMWSDDMTKYPDMDVASDAWRIVRDVYGKVASNYAAIGEWAKAQEAVDAIGIPEEIASRLTAVVGTKSANFDAAWLRKTLEIAIQAAFPFDRTGSYLDDGNWRELLQLAVSANLSELVAAQESRFEEYAKTQAFKRLDAKDKEEDYTSMLRVALMRDEFAKAQNWLAMIEDAGRKEYGRMLLGQAYAAKGDKQNALKLADGMDSGRRSEILTALFIFAAQNSDLANARTLLRGIEEDSRTYALQDLAIAGHIVEAEKLSVDLNFGERARLFVSIISLLGSEGKVDEAAALASKVNEVGERAVAYAKVAVFAARAGRADLVDRAEQEIEKMSRAGVDRVQIADSLVIANFGRAILLQKEKQESKIAAMKKRINGIVPSAFPDDPLGALGASEDRARLLIEFAALQFALGMPDDAQKSITEVATMSGERSPDADASEEAFITAEAAGIAYGVAGAELASDAVKQSLKKIATLKLPMDRAMMYSHLAEKMFVSP